MNVAAVLCYSMRCRVGQATSSLVLSSAARFHVFVRLYSRRERARINLIQSRLFAIFDQDGNGVVDFGELIAGLSVLCGGEEDEKISQAFRLIDVNGDGLISIDEMIVYLAAVFRVRVYACDLKLSPSIA